MEKVDLRDPKKVVPKQVWVYLLSFLDGPSLRESLRVNKTWKELGSDERLEHLSKRTFVERLKIVEGKTACQLLQWTISEPESFGEYVRARKEKGTDIVYKKMVEGLWMVKLVPNLLFLVFSTRWKMVMGVFVSTVVSFFHRLMIYEVTRSRKSANQLTEGFGNFLMCSNLIFNIFISWELSVSFKHSSMGSLLAYSVFFFL